MSILRRSVVPEGEGGTDGGTGISEVAQSSHSRPEASASAPAVKMPTMWSVGRALAAAAGTGSRVGGKMALLSSFGVLLPIKGREAPSH